MDDDKVQGKDGEGCSERKKAAKTKKGTVVADNDNSEADKTEGKSPKHITRLLTNTWY